LRIARSMLDEIVAQARDEAPNECCGLVGTRDGRAVTLFKARNARASPFAYEIDSKDLLHAYNAIDDAGMDVGIIYHSHTRRDAGVSQTDINLAKFPDAVYLIVGVQDPDDEEIAAWYIRDGRVSEAPLEVEEG
jgi:[CysO sulfur-carrier protein]-S-L-cysteine hydrolase